MTNLLKTIKTSRRRVNSNDLTFIEEQIEEELRVKKEKLES